MAITINELETGIGLMVDGNLYFVTELTHVKPGVCCAEIDAQARKVLRKFGLAKYFGHSLGHGVGLDIHESPRLSSQSPSILEEGMIITVEPGVYIPDQFGIRVEDMILVTKEGCEVLSGYYN